MINIEAFRAETRAWLSENCPPGARGPGEISWGSTKLPVQDPDTQLWLERSAEKGWTVPTWPVEYGGAGLERDEYGVLMEELRRIDARTPLTGRGVNYIGPTILEYGNDDQKARWLPRIARGEGGWCMGYSEPGAGSDLASLSMRAVDHGDHFLINGMKTWTSDAMYGDWIFCLVRTDPDAPKHEGISFLLVDMDQPGVRVRPIRLISGNSPFCETFFEDAIAKKEDLLGELNHGWTVGKRLLQFERSTHGGVNISGTQRSEDAPRLADIVRGYVGEVNGRIAQREMRERVTRFEMDSHAYRLTQRRAMEEARARAPGSASSIFKMCGANLTQERADIHREVMGFDGLGWEGAPFGDEQIQATRTWLSSRATTIYGGTNEIQMNIIAQRVLGLPD